MSSPITHRPSSPTYAPSISDVESESESEEQTQNELPLDEPFADCTYLKIDEKAAERLKELKQEVSISEILTWISRGKCAKKDCLRGTSDKISIREARIINERSNRKIFEIDINNLTEIKVIESVQTILAKLNKKHNFTKISLTLKSDRDYLRSIKRGAISYISKEDAEKIESHFKKNIFRIHNIFERACTENLSVTKTEIDLLTFIKIDKETRKKLDNLDDATKLKINRILKTHLFSKNPSFKEISARHAVIVNKISETVICELSVDNLAYLPCSNEAQCQIKEKIRKKNSRVRRIAKDLKIPESTIRALMKGTRKSISYENAIKINQFLENPDLFAFKKILEDAEANATDFYNSLQAKDQVKLLDSSTRKRTTPETIPEEEPSHLVKKKKPNPNESIDSDDNSSTSSEDHVDEKSQNGPFADSTYMKIDEKAAERLEKLKQKVGTTKIFTWIDNTGHNRNHCIHGENNKISIREARLINAQADERIFKPTVDNLLEFKVIDSARKILKELNEKSDFKSVCNELGFDDGYLKRIKKGRLKNISKKDAKKIERHFKRDIFSFSKIFKWAIKEKLGKIILDSDLLTMIKIDQPSNARLNDLSDSIKSKIKKSIGFQFNTNIKTSVRKCVVINEISGSQTVDISTKNLDSVPCPKEVQDRIAKLFKQKHPNDNFPLTHRFPNSTLTYRKLKLLMDGGRKSVDVNTAGQVNDFFDMPIFDFGKIIADAKDDALHFYNSFPKTEEIEATTSSTKKRKSSETTPEEEFSPVKKKKPNPEESIETHALPPFLEETQIVADKTEASTLVPKQSEPAEKSGRRLLTLRIRKPKQIENPPPIQPKIKIRIKDRTTKTDPAQATNEQITPERIGHEDVAVERSQPLIAPNQWSLNAFDDGDFMQIPDPYNFLLEAPFDFGTSPEFDSFTSIL
jgi:hypothetical protein